MNTANRVVIPVIVGIASVVVFLLESLPLKYTVAVACASPVVLAFALTHDKKKFLLGAIVLALPFARMTFFLGPRREFPRGRRPIGSPGQHRRPISGGRDSA